MIPNSRSFKEPRVEELSSDDDCNSDNDIKPFLRHIYFENSRDDAISIESESEDSDLEMVDVKIPKKVNDVWRNIIECDFLQQEMNNIRCKRKQVLRDVESYELPIRKRKRISRHTRPFKKRIKSRNLKIEDDDVLIIDDESNQLKSVYAHDDFVVIDIISDEDDSIEPLEASSANMNSLESNYSSAQESVESDSNSDTEFSTNLSKLKKEPKHKARKKTPPNCAWTRLANRMQNEEMLAEFEKGRKQLARKIAIKLDEPKVDLIDRCLYYLGLEKCKVFLEAVKEIEENGGMPTKDGSRRRTTGGVFFTLIRSDRTIDRSIKMQIFNEREDTLNNEDASLWWKSLEVLQYRFNSNSNSNMRLSKCVSSFARRKEFKSYTLLDIDFFESIPDFRYRYIPMMTNFPWKNVIGGPNNSVTTMKNLADINTITVDSDDDDDSNANDKDVDAEDDYFMRLPDHLDPFNPINL